MYSIVRESGSEGGRGGADFSKNKRKKPTKFAKHGNPYPVGYIYINKSHYQKQFILINA